MQNQSISPNRWNGVERLANNGCQRKQIESSLPLFSFSIVSPRGGGLNQVRRRLEPSTAAGIQVRWRPKPGTAAGI
jgi:hypothetical protein